MDRIQALVEKLPQEVDGALITSTVNRHYFTGLRSSAGVLLVTRKGCSAARLSSRRSWRSSCPSW